jgi:hypothetical protein
MYRVLLATRAVLLEFQPIGIVAAILFGGVISLLAIIALQGDYRANVFLLGSHVTTLLSDLRITR